MVHDAATGQSWQAFDWRVGLFDSDPPWVRTVRNGLIVMEDKTLRYVLPDGTERAVLIEAIPRGNAVYSLVVPPDAARVVVLMGWDGLPEGYIHGGEGSGPTWHSLSVYDFQSKQLTPIWIDEPSGCTSYNSYVSRWSEDGRAFSLHYDDYEADCLAGVTYADTAVFKSAPAGILSAGQLSPDFRHAVRFWIGPGRGYRDGRSFQGGYNEPGRFEIIEYETERIVWPWDPSTPLLDHGHWKWLSADQFAWSSGDSPAIFNFRSGEVVEGLEPAEISILTLSTSEVELIDSAEYLERFPPSPEEPESEPPASVQCPDDPTLPCQVLLDGQVVGEGLWANVVGFIELD